MSVFDQHIGAWSGTYTVLDAHDREIDRHDVRVTCRRDGDTWSQTTIRTWLDGRTKESVFTGQFRGDLELIYDHPNVQGRALAVSDRDIVSMWVDPDVPRQRYISLITLVSDNERVQTVQEMEGDRLAARLLIKEKRS